MKQQLSTQSSGRAPAALSQPQPTATAKNKPTAEQIEEALKRWVDQEIEQFNCDLEIARRVYRSNPKLVQSPSYPEPWRTLHMEANEGQAPRDRDTQTAPSIARLRKQFLPKALETATVWANKESTHDGERLSPATNLVGKDGDLPTRSKGGSMVSEGLIGTINAHGECLSGFAAFLDRCDNTDDMQNMALVFRAYQNEYKAGGWIGDALANVLLDVGVRLAAGDNREDITSLLDGCPDSTYSPASNISSHLKLLLERLDDADLEFIAGLLGAIFDGHAQKPSTLSPREAVALFTKNLDVPATESMKRPPKPSAKGKAKRAA